MKMLFMVLVLVTTNAFASYITAKMSGQEMMDKGLLLQYLQLGCKDPGAVHNQRPPHDIKVLCHSEQCRWRLGPTTRSVKENYKSVCGKIETDKPNLGTLNKCKSASCQTTTFELPTLFEECGKYDTMYNVTCEQVLAMTSVEAFCLAATDVDIAEMSEVMDWKATGKAQAAVLAPETKPTQR